MPCERGEGKALVCREAQLIDGATDIALREAQAADAGRELIDDETLSLGFAEGETHVTYDDAIDVYGDRLARALRLGEVVDGVLDVQPSRLRIADEPKIRLEESGRGDAYLLLGDEVAQGDPPDETVSSEHTSPSGVEDDDAMRLDIRPGHKLDTLQLYGAVKYLGEQACHTAGCFLLYSRDTEESEGEEVEQDEEGSSYPCYYLQYLEEMTIDLPMAHALRSLTCSYIIIVSMERPVPSFRITLPVLRVVPAKVLHYHVALSDLAPSDDRHPTQ